LSDRRPLEATAHLILNAVDEVSAGRENLNRQETIKRPGWLLFDGGFRGKHDIRSD